MPAGDDNSKLDSVPNDIAEQFYFWDRDSTLIDASTPDIDRIGSAIHNIAKENPTLKHTDPAFSKLVLERLALIRVRNGFSPSDILLNEEKLLPILTSIVRNSGKIFVLSAGLNAASAIDDKNNNLNMVYSDSTFQIFNALIPGFSEANLELVKSRKAENFIIGSSSSEETIALQTEQSLAALYYLKEGLTYGDDWSDQKGQYRQSYLDSYGANNPPICYFQINKTLPNGKIVSLNVQLDVKQFLAKRASLNKEYNIQFADDGQKFLMVLDSLFKQDTQVLFDKDQLAEFGFDIQYPDNWEPKKKILPSQISVVDDKPLFLQFFETTGCKTYVANTGDAKKAQLKEGTYDEFVFYRDNIKKLSEAQMAERYADENLNSFADELLNDFNAHGPIHGAVINPTLLEKFPLFANYNNEIKQLNRFIYQQKPGPEKDALIAKRDEIIEDVKKVAAKVHHNANYEPTKDLKQLITNCHVLQNLPMSTKVRVAAGLSVPMFVASSAIANATLAGTTGAGLLATFGNVVGLAAGAGATAGAPLGPIGIGVGAAVGALLGAAAVLIVGTLIGVGFGLGYGLGKLLSKISAPTPKTVTESVFDTNNVMHEISISDSKVLSRAFDKDQKKPKTEDKPNLEQIEIEEDIDVTHANSGSSSASEGSQSENEGSGFRLDMQKNVEIVNNNEDENARKSSLSAQHQEGKQKAPGKFSLMSPKQEPKHTANDLEAQKLQGPDVNSQPKEP